MQVLTRHPVPGLTAEHRDTLIETIIPLACEAADDLWLKHMLEVDDAGEHEGQLRSVFLLPSRWDPRVFGDGGMPALGPGLLGRLRQAGWHNIAFSDLDEYGRFRAELSAGTLAPPPDGFSLLHWYSGIVMRFPRVARAARFVLTIPFTNTNVRSWERGKECELRDVLRQLVLRWPPYDAG